MALTITPNVATVLTNKTKIFEASGGVEPYFFSVTDGNGSVNESNGIFTAPPVAGESTVQVTDSDDPPAIANAAVTIEMNTPLKSFCDVLQQELELDDGRVYLWDQKINMPTDTGLFIAVGVQSVKFFGNARSTSEDLGGGLSETLSVNCQATLSIDLISRGTDARDRKEEVILALRSIYSEQIQEAGGFYIAALPSAFVNLSEIDGSAIPYRFNASLALQYQVTKTKAVQYYDDFSEPTVVTDP